MTPALIACSHGTSSLAGRRAIRTLIDQIGTLLPGVRIEEAFVDVQEPAVGDVVARVSESSPVIVVPLLLSTGFHTRVDIARAVAAHPDRAIAAPALGPHDLLALVLESRLAALDIDGDDAVVLAAAGSTDPAAAVDVERMAQRLAACLHAPVTVGYAAGAGTRVADAVAQARATGSRRVVAASYVLAPGYFADVLAGAGADAVTAPLAPDIRVAALAAERYRDAAALGEAPLSA